VRRSGGFNRPYQVVGVLRFPRYPTIPHADSSFSFDMPTHPSSRLANLLSGSILFQPASQPHGSNLLIRQSTLQELVTNNLYTRREVQERDIPGATSHWGRQAERKEREQSTHSMPYVSCNPHNPATQIHPTIRVEANNYVPLLPR
jgi:hypothetical protein